MPVVMIAAWLAGCHTKDMVGNEASIAGTEHVCASCHGANGRSNNPDFPNLAGQQKTYLQAQLHAFHNKTRADPHAHTYMWGMAANLDGPTIDGLAAVFAAEPAAPGSAQDPDLVAAGRKIFVGGIPAAHVPPCMACHGAHALGAGPIPRLASQHRVYLEEQLHAFKVNSRANKTMHANAQSMDDEQIRDISAYLASLS